MGRLFALAALPLLIAGTPVELAVHVAIGEDGNPVADAAWIDAQVAAAGDKHAGADVTFTWHDAGDGGIARDIVTVDDRDSLAPVADGCAEVHVFVVAKLADKDVEGHWLNGVHWRGGGTRYVILSHETQWPNTLAHELGHFFGLAHTENPDGLMTTGVKRSGADPSLTAAQLKRVKKRAKAWARQCPTKTASERPATE